MPVPTLSTAVPRIRFPEFRDAPAWEPTTIGELVRHKASSRKQGELSPTPVGYPVYSTKGIAGYASDYDQEHQYIGIVARGSAGKFYLLGGKSSASGTMSYLTARDSSYLPWVYALLSSVNLLYYQMGEIIPCLNFTDYSVHPVLAPDISEQKRIGDFFYALDGFITAGDKTLASLRQLKKWLLEQLFPQEGERIPRIRFPEFQDAGEWEEKSLGEIAGLVNDRVGQRVLTTLSISAGQGFVSQEEKFGRDISGGQYEYYTVVKHGDFVYNKGNSKRFPQGCVYEYSGAREAAVPRVFITFRFQEGYCNSFYQYCFEKNMHGKQLEREITAGPRNNGLLNISKQKFFAIKLLTPSFSEQKRVGDTLSTLDAIIEAKRLELDALRRLRKGFVQQMFPSEK